LKNLFLIWKLLFLLHIFLLVGFFSTSSSSNNDILMIHLSIFHTLIAHFFVILAIPIYVGFKLKKQVFFPVFMIIIFNIPGSLFLYFYFKRCLIFKEQK